MTRVKTIRRQSDAPEGASKADSEASKEFFDTFFREFLPHLEDKEIPQASIGFSIVSHNPKLALNLLDLSKFMARDLPWSQDRTDLKELSVQTLNLHYKCEASFEPHLAYAVKAGLSAEQQAAIPYWKTSSLFDDEQRLIIEYTMGVVKNAVTDELFGRVVERYGERRAVEMTSAIAWWSFWAMILNAVRSDPK